MIVEVRAAKGGDDAKLLVEDQSNLRGVITRAHLPLIVTLHKLSRCV